MASILAFSRLQPIVVVPEQPGDHLILGLTPSLKALPVQPLYLQRSKQGRFFTLIGGASLKAELEAVTATFGATVGN